MTPPPKHSSLPQVPKVWLRGLYAESVSACIVKGYKSWSRNSPHSHFEYCTVWLVHRFQVAIWRWEIRCSFHSSRKQLLHSINHNHFHKWPSTEPILGHIFVDAYFLYCSWQVCLLTFCRGNPYLQFTAIRWCACVEQFWNTILPAPGDMHPTIRKIVHLDGYSSWAFSTWMDETICRETSCTAEDVKIEWLILLNPDSVKGQGWTVCQ